MVLCQWLKKNTDAIQTGNETLDSTISVLLGTSILVGGFVGCFLGHVIPGTLEERGIIAWQKEIAFDSDGASEDEHTTYDLPFAMETLKR